ISGQGRILPPPGSGYRKVSSSITGVWSKKCWWPTRLTLGELRVAHTFELTGLIMQGAPFLPPRAGRPHQPRQINDHKCPRSLQGLSGPADIVLTCRAAPTRHQTAY